MSERMRGKVALVTGAGSGLGRAIAVGLASEGANLVLIGRTEATLKGTAGALDPARCLVQMTDLRSPAEIDEAVAQAIARFGRIDALVNNAAVIESELGSELSIERWSEVIATNLTAPFLLSKATIPHMIAGRGGSIVNVGSVASTSGGSGGVAYTASKHGLVGLTRQFAMQYGHQGIRVNCLCPGLFATEMTSESLSDPRQQAFVSKLPVGRAGRPDEFAKAAVFLASDDSSYVTGATWVVDGGFTLGHFRGGNASPTGDIGRGPLS